MLAKKISLINQNKYQTNFKFVGCPSASMIWSERLKKTVNKTDSTPKPTISLAVWPDQANHTIPRAITSSKLESDDFFDLDMLPSFDKQILFEGTTKKNSIGKIEN